MRRSPRIPFGAACILALALAGCDTAPVHHPNSTQTVVLSPANASPTVEMDIVTAVRVILPGPEAGSGYTWEIASNNSRVLEQMGPLKASQAPGAVATTEVSFFSLRPGKSVLRFFLVRPQEAEAVPAGAYEVTVRITD